MKDSPDIGIIRAMIDMAKPTRFKDPKVEVRRDTRKPFYYIRIPDPQDPKKRKSIPLGFCDEITLGMAKLRKQEIMAPINQGKFIFQQSVIIFKDLVEKFLAGRLPDLGSNTQAKYQQQIKVHILPEFGNKRLCDIDMSSIKIWLANKAKPVLVPQGEGKPPLEQDGLSWWTRCDLRSILSAIFTYAIEMKLWNAGNPCHGVKVGKKRVKRIKQAVAPEDFIRFLAALPETKLCTKETAKLMALTSVVSGLRVSEVLGLQPRDIDFKQKTITVSRRWSRGDVADPKTQASERTREVGELIDALARQAVGLAPTDFLFRYRGGKPPDDRDLQQHVWRPAAVDVGIYFEGFGMHTFRRLNVTWRQTIGGASPVEAQKAAGHASLSLTMLYTQNDRDRERKHVAAILDLVSGKVNPDGQVN